MFVSAFSKSDFKFFLFTGASGKRSIIVLNSSKVTIPSLLASKSLNKFLANVSKHI